MAASFSLTRRTVCSRYGSYLYRKLHVRGKIRNVSIGGTDSQAPVRVRRRDDELMAAIRAATRAELVDFGYAGVSYEGVARRARTSKPVLYRRYPTRAHMVVDALPNLHWRPDEDVVFESLRDDLMHLFGVAVEGFRVIGIDNYRRLIADADDELLNSLDGQITKLSVRTIYPALARARDRGEIGGRHIPHRAATLIGTLVRDELFFARRDVDSTTLAELLDTVYLPLIKAISR
jgi:AcrR family transcriptional regulator